MDKKTVSIKRAPILQPKLSKKKRKHLEKLVEQKEKKAKRGELLEKLNDLRVPSSELARYHSIAHIGNKKQQEKSVWLAKRPDSEILKEEKINSIKGAKKAKLEIDEKGEKEAESSDVSTDEESDSENGEKEWCKSRSLLIRLSATLSGFKFRSDELVEYFSASVLFSVIFGFDFVPSSPNFQFQFGFRSS